MARPFQPRGSDPRSKMLSFRASQVEIDQLDRLAGALNLPTKADVLRLAMGYWLAHAPEAKRLAKDGPRGEGG